VRAAGLTSIEWRVLAALHEGPPLTVSELAPKKLQEKLTQHP
jgi:DNA-binding MarR family transcriptional regulator